MRTASTTISTGVGGIRGGVRVCGKGRGVCPGVCVCPRRGLCIQEGMCVSRGVSGRCVWGVYTHPLAQLHAGIHNSPPPPNCILGYTPPSSNCMLGYTSCPIACWDTPPPCWQTGTYENITFPQQLLRSVVMRMISVKFSLFTAVSLCLLPCLLFYGHFVEPFLSLTDWKLVTSSFHINFILLMW